MTEDTASGKYTDPLSLNKYTYCHNQPVTGYDPDGHALHIAAGALVGGLIGGAMSYVSQAWQNKSFTKGINWKQVAGSAAEGAITGGIGGLTMGASLAATAGGTAVKSVAKVGIKAAAKTTIKTVAKSSAIDAVFGFAGNTASQLITGGAGNYSVTQAVTSGVVEALNIPGGEAGEKTAKKVGNELMETLSEKLGKAAGSEVVEEAGSKSLAKTLTNSGAAGVNGTGSDPYALMKEKGIPQTLSDAEIDAAKQVDLQMNAKKANHGKLSRKAKTGPKPKGTGPHNLKIEEIASQISDGKVIAGGGRGYPPEAVIPTPGGIKSSRRPDILVRRPDDSIYGINVGKTTAKGAPIKREVEALYDLEDAGIAMYFVSYDK